jgi:hypothetical protein
MEVIKFAEKCRGLDNSPIAYLVLILSQFAKEDVATDYLID